ncbi:hypothetical protein PCANC_16501 [Puccinia coronata f. sp. avenae]|uniref:Uncharacterized protein n=1 Tax=Puccinia coronata f. sp. avenae TaxID=200324 RepID=A0A2N5SR59_9BASI|nr:hypothetical protein PCANC_16501 [Puccinia coronata f. sp. avenae]
MARVRAPFAPAQSLGPPIGGTGVKLARPAFQVACPSSSDNGGLDLYKLPR